VSKDKPETSAADFFPERKSLKAFRAAAADCKGCDLWERGTQTVCRVVRRQRRLLRAEHLRWPQFIRLRSCAHLMMKLAIWKNVSSLTT